MGVGPPELGGGLLFPSTSACICYCLHLKFFVTTGWALSILSRNRVFESSNRHGGVLMVAALPTTMGGPSHSSDRRCRPVERRRRVLVARPQLYVALRPCRERGRSRGRASLARPAQCLRRRHRRVHTNCVCLSYHRYRHGARVDTVQVAFAKRFAHCRGVEHARRWRGLCAQRWPMAAAAWSGAIAFCLVALPHGPPRVRTRRVCSGVPRVAARSVVGALRAATARRSAATSSPRVRRRVRGTRLVSTPIQ